VLVLVLLSLDFEGLFSIIVFREDNELAVIIEVLTLNWVVVVVDTDSLISEKSRLLLLFISTSKLELGVSGGVINF